jgi:hypothetical protein
MQGLFAYWYRRAAMWLVPLSVALFGWAPARAGVDVDRDIDEGGGLDVGDGTLIREGDPLDTNDASGDATDPRYDYVDGADGGVLKPSLRIMPSGQPFYLVPVYRGGMLIFQIVYLDDSGPGGGR